MVQSTDKDWGEKVVELTDYIEQSVNELLSNCDPADLIITEEIARGIMQDILDDIPADCRCLYPKDDFLAAIAYAQVYYNMR